MKKLILVVALVLALTMSVSAAVTGVYDLTGYNDTHAAFLNFLASKNNLTAVVNWMQANFTHIPHTPAYTPYQQWLYKNGDCNDMSTFVLYWAFRWGVQSQFKQVYIMCNEPNVAHMLAIYIDYSDYYYISNQYCNSIAYNSFAACVAAWDNSDPNHSVNWWNAYNYDLNLISAAGSKGPSGVANVAPVCLE